MFTIHCSRFTIHDSRFTVHDSWFTIHGSRSQFTVHDSQFTVQFTIQTHSQFTREAGERRARGRARCETDIGRREGAQKQGRAYGPGEGEEGRGGKLTVQCLWFTVDDSQFTVHDSQFTVHGSRFMVHGSRFAVHDSQRERGEGGMEGEREGKREREAQGIEGGEVELGARERYIARREGAQGQGRAWEHRHKGRGEGRGGVGRGVELTVQCS